MTDSAVQLRLVPAQPQQLRRGEPGQCAVAGQLDEPGEADALLDLRALGGGALVVPQDRGAQHALLGVEDDEPVHLPRQTDRPFGQPAQDAFGGAPPVLRLLLRPAGMWPPERVLRARRGEHVPLLVNGDALDGRGADIEADERRHVTRRARRTPARRRGRRPSRAARGAARPRRSSRRSRR